jgi:hypothetical protein
MSMKRELSSSLEDDEVEKTEEVRLPKHMMIE